MRRGSYAVWWKEGDGPRHVGKLEVARLHALLSGSGSRRVAVPLDQITAVEWQRGEVLVTRKGAPVLQIGSLDAPGALREVAYRLVPSVTSVQPA
jgi:hypothetical protein